METAEATVGFCASVLLAQVLYSREGVSPYVRNKQITVNNILASGLFGIGGEQCSGQVYS